MKRKRPTKKTLQRISAYLKNLPTKHLDGWDKLFDELPEDTANNIKNVWMCTGTSLSYYFKGNPTPQWNAPEHIKLMIDENVALYATLSLVCFQAEEIIREYADEFDIDFVKNLHWRHFVQMWAVEQCRQEIWLFSQEFWESHSLAKIEERQRDIKKILNDQTTQATEEKLYKKWDTQDENLTRSNPEQLEKLCPWSSFLLTVFSLNRSAIPSYSALEALMLKPIDRRILENKAFIQEGITTYFSGRGKNKDS